MSRLTLIGTVHRDPKGLATLVQVLHGLKPDILTLEFSSYGLRYRQRRKKLLRQRFLESLREIRGTAGFGVGELKDFCRSAGIGGIIALLALPFEYKAARFFSQRHCLPLFCLDVSSCSRQLLSHIDELLSPANLRKVVAFEAEPIQQAVKREYSFAENLLLDGRGSHWWQLITRDKKLEKRDKIIAQRIRKILASYPRGHVVHIGGWQHLLARQGTLFTLLEDLKPRRVLLRHL